jgi:hypothetical protein
MGEADMFLFKQRKKKNELQQLLRRAMDLTSPNHPPRKGEMRWEERSNRTIPVLLSPWANGKPLVDEHTVALSKDLSSQGVALVLPQPFRAEQVVLGFWLELMPEFILGKVRQNASLGGGFWQLGVELTERLPLADHKVLESLVPFAMHLKN